MAWSLEDAKKHLNAWLQAELACATGQSYKIGPKQLTRADLAEIRAQIKFWRKEVTKLKGRGARKAIRFIPRDL